MGLYWDDGKESAIVGDIGFRVWGSGSRVV